MRHSGASVHSVMLLTMTPSSGGGEKKLPLKAICSRGLPKKQSWRWQREESVVHTLNIHTQTHTYIIEGIVGSIDSLWVSTQ